MLTHRIQSIITHHTNTYPSACRAQRSWASAPPPADSDATTVLRESPLAARSLRLCTPAKEIERLMWWIIRDICEREKLWEKIAARSVCTSLFKFKRTKHHQVHVTFFLRRWEIRQYTPSSAWKMHIPMECARRDNQTAFCRAYTTFVTGAAAPSRIARPRVTPHRSLSHFRI